jgi:putative flavoprotein involved in K+ transport
MGRRAQVVIIGGGQAGLSVSYHLSQRDREHVVLERAGIAETWRSERWARFYLNPPTGPFSYPAAATAAMSRTASWPEIKS